MTHIPETQLALYSRRDLGVWARLRVRRHLERCEMCAEIAAEFGQIGERLSDAAETLPAELSEAAWNRLSAEMTANIRLGIAAGECISGVRRPLARPKLVAALAGLTALVAMAVMEQPHPKRLPAPTMSPEIQSARIGGGAIMEPLPSAGDVMHTVNTRGDMRSRYVDDTGVTIVDVYADAE